MKTKTKILLGIEALCLIVAIAAWYCKDRLANWLAGEQYVVLDMREQEVEIQAKVIKYQKNGLHIDLHDEAGNPDFMWKDLIVLSIISPTKWTGTSLYISCSPRPKDSS